MWGKDKEGRKSITSSFTVTVSKKGSTTISGILLPPTIELEKTSLQKGKILNILGQTGSQSEVSIFINSSAKEIIKRETKARTDGKWFYAFDTTILEEGSYTVQAKSLTSTFSQTLAFTIGEAGGKTGPKGADINKDGKVNLVDFSILLYNWNIPKNTMADLNYDGKVNLVDFSIMLYYWTG